MNKKERARVERNAELLERIEEMALKDVLALYKGEDYESPLTDTARGQILKFLKDNGFNADITSIPSTSRLASGLTAEDLADTAEASW
jgi:hypothetical protein